MDYIIIALLIINIIIAIIVMSKMNNKSEKGSEVTKENISEIIKNEINIANLEGVLKISKELNGNTENLVSKFNDFQISINTTMASNNEKLITKFGMLEKTISNDLGENNTKLVGKFGEVEKHLDESLLTFNDSFKRNLDANVEKLMGTVEFKLNNINEKVEERLKTGFEKTTETFNSIIERLAKIDEAQKNIEALSGNIVSLQDILSDKKTRGIFGEVQLYQVLYSVFGEPSDNIYQTQYTFNNGTIADAVLFAPEPLGTIAIDSKFPLENYKRMMDKSATEEERKNAESGFKINMKKHIDDISSKYIIPGTTSDQAILFLPAEAIFAELNAYYGDLIEYGQKKRVWIASPTTIMAVLNTLQIIIKDAERQKYAHEIQQHLQKLSQEFSRYRIRWDNLAKDIDKVSKDVKEINTTSVKISRRFESISNAEDMDNLVIED